MTAMPLMIAILCLMAIAFRYYSAWIAAKVAVLDDSRLTPAVRLNDGQNYHPTNKWVLFGHHFAAISGAGPLIGPVVAAQFGYLPGLLWIVIGVCLGGAVQDFLVLVASMRRNGRSLAQIAFEEIGRTGGSAAMLAILVIIVLALAGLGKVVVNALGGESVRYPADSFFSTIDAELSYKTLPDGTYLYRVPAGTWLHWGKNQEMQFTDGFDFKSPLPMKTTWIQDKAGSYSMTPIPPGAVRVMPGSPWGTFTIAATIPIALLVGLYMYKIRPGKVLEASLIGGALTVAATFIGGWVAHSSIGPWFNLSTMGVTWAMAIYGFVAAVLPVWVLLAPRDYLSSFLKIGTIALLVIGTIVANPKLEAPAINHTFLNGGPVVAGKIFPFLFIVLMCGAISGFHALVSSGTTPKMIEKERQARAVGYGAMLIEGLVAVVAMMAAASLPVRDYYAMNTQLAKIPEAHDKILQVAGAGGVEHVGQYEQLTNESLRGRPGGAVTLAVGMAHIFDRAVQRFSTSGEQAMQSLWKYWYHFAIMFEALFILTTIDAGTRIGRFLVQEMAGKLHPQLGRTDWWPGAIASTLLIVFAWAWFMNSDSFDTIWTMFGIANQMLAVIALSIVSVCIINEGRGRYVWVTVIPLAVVMTTTGSAAVLMLSALRNSTLTAYIVFKGVLILIIVGCAAVVLISAVARVLAGTRPRVGFEPVLGRQIG